MRKKWDDHERSCGREITFHRLMKDHACPYDIPRSSARQRHFYPVRQRYVRKVSSLMRGNKDKPSESRAALVDLDFLRMT